MQNPHVHSLDQPGSIDRQASTLGGAASVLILLIAGASIVFGNQRLEVYPRFSTLYICVVFVLDAVSSYVLFGQFRYQRHPTYAILAAAYLFVALAMVPYVLAFRSALKDDGQVIGGDQTAIWVWYFWHLSFPPIVAAAVHVHQHACARLVPSEWVGAVTLTAITSAVALALLVGGLTTSLHAGLPRLLTPELSVVVPQFYWIGGITAAITFLCAWYCWHEGKRQRTILHLWLAVTLLAYLADVLMNVGATSRYTVSWYMARVESMIAASLLLLFFLGQINRLYHRLSITTGELLDTNRQLGDALRDKDELVASLRQSEEQIRQFAYYDALTDLPNRRLLLDRLNQELARARRHRHSIAIMFMDLDRFKEVNDTLGHDAGDQLLVQVAQRMSACLRKDDTASRSGGDEFIIVLPEISQPNDAALVAQKIIDAMHPPVEIGSHRVHASLSIGIAIYPIDGTDDVRDLLQKADQAMYSSKVEGRNQYRFFSPDMVPKQPDLPSL